MNALTVGIMTKKVNWVLDADIRAFFDTLDHGWLVKFVEHRVADRRAVRLIQKWLSAGVLEDGKRTRSEVVAVRFADDFAVGFEHREDAERFLAELRERCAKFGRFADSNRRKRGGGKPETFNFLRFTHSCAKTKAGKFTVLRQTMRTRLRAKLEAVKTELRRRLHDPVPEQGPTCARSSGVTSGTTACP